MPNIEGEIVLLMTGGGTLGPVTPLLAIAEEWQHLENIKVYWIGTKRGPERALVESCNIPFKSIWAPKIDRVRPWRILFVPIKFIFSFFESLNYLRKIRPDIIFTAGGYVSVPVVISGWILRIKIWIHQLDYIPGIANKIMAPFASRISVTWDESKDFFSKDKTKVVGGVMRQALLYGDRPQACERYGLDPSMFTLLIIGGGTGAKEINSVMEAVAQDLLPYMQVIHLTGKGKMTAQLSSMGDRYVALEFLGVGMKDAFAISDMVLARAGMGTIIELSALRKPTILIPLHNTDQLGNAKKLEERGAAEVLYEANPQIVRQTIMKLFNDKEKRVRMSARISGLFSAFGARDIVLSARELLRING